MISAFVHRRPWATALVALVFGPIVVMLYVGKGRLAGCYFLISVVALTVPYPAAHYDLLPLSAESAMWVNLAIVHLVGVVHAYRLAGRLLGEAPQVWYARWYIAIVLVVAVSNLLPVIMRTYLWEPFNIPAASMEPSLLVGDHLFVSKSAYRFSKPERGDLVVFLIPRDNSTAFVKRLIGLAGDQIQMRSGELYLNGERISRSLVESNSVLDAKEDGQIYRETLPSGRSYLIRELHDVGFMDNTDVYRVPPEHYFFLGDNRDNSMDSRVLDSVGYVPAENLIGPVSMVYWNSERQKLLFMESD